VLEVNDKGKQTPKKVGLAPVQREGMEYEFTVMLDVDMNHIASSSKDRTGLFDGRFFKISEATGKELLTWLETGEAGPDVDAIVRGIRNSATLEILKSNWEAALQMLPEHHRSRVNRAKEERKAELTAAQFEDLPQ
jgi:hypothetical protein